MASRRRTLAAALGALVLAAGCTSGGAPSATDPSTSSPPPPAAWTSPGPAPLSRLAVAAGRIAYLADGSLVGLDPTTGAVVWQREALVPPAPDGQRPSFVVDGDQLLSLEPLGGRADAASLVGVDAADGSVRWRAALPGLPLAPPARCGDAACVAVAPPGGPAVLVAVDRDHGTTRVAGHLLGTTVVAMAGDAVLSVLDGQLVLADERADHVVWQVPVGELSLAAAPARWRAWAAPDGRWVVWADGRFTGITAAGVALWRADGRPCPFVADDTTRTGAPDLPLLVCFGDPVASIAALDPATGAARWQLGDAPLGSGVAVEVVRTSDRSWLLSGRPGPRFEIDLVDGPRLPGDDVAGGWCGVPAAVPCDLAAQPVGAVEAVPTYAGVEVDGWGAWAAPTGVSASRLP